MSYSALEKEIVAAIAAASERVQAPWNPGQWTKLLKEGLRRLGESKGYGVCASGFPGQCDPEWLYDLVWYSTTASGELLDVPLVVECEWHLPYPEIRNDFQKLILARSQYRVMIFAARDEKLESVFEALHKEVSESKLTRKADRYVLIGVTEEGGELVDRHLVV